MFGKFFINIFNRCINFQFEDLKNSSLGGYFGEMEIYIKNLIVQSGGSYQKLFNSVLSAHRLRVYAKFGILPKPIRPFFSL